jgi:hypothetical protein
MDDCTNCQVPTCGIWECVEDICRSCKESLPHRGYYCNHASVERIELIRNPPPRMCYTCKVELESKTGHSIGRFHSVCPKCHECPDCDDGSC